MKKSAVAWMLCLAAGLCGTTAQAHRTNFVLGRGEPSFADDVTVTGVEWNEDLTGTMTGFLSGTWTMTNHVGFRVTGIPNPPPGAPDITGWAFSRGEFELGNSEYTGYYAVVVDPQGGKDTAYGFLWGTGPGGGFQATLTMDESDYPDTSLVLSFTRFNDEQIYEELSFGTGTRTSSARTYWDGEGRNPPPTLVDIWYDWTWAGNATGPYATGTIGTPLGGGLTAFWLQDDLTDLRHREGAVWGPLGTSTTPALGNGFLWTYMTGPDGIAEGMMSFPDYPEAQEAVFYGTRERGGPYPNTFVGYFEHQLVPPLGFERPAVPEPAGIALLGLISLAVRRRRR